MKMFEKKRLHPVSAIVFAMKYLKEAVFPIILAFIIGGTGEEATFLEKIIIVYVPIGIVILTFISGFLSWFRYQYWIENRELRIEHGWFVRKRRFIPIERIQSISTSEGIFLRIFGLVKVDIETAGGPANEAEAILRAITKADLLQLQAEIRKAKDGPAFVVETDGDGSPESQEVTVNINTLDSGAGELVYKTSFEEIFLFALTSGGALGILGALTAFLAEFSEQIPFQKLYDEVQIIIASSVLFIVFLSAVIILIAYGIAIIRTILKYMDYTVEKTEKHLRISHGLLEKREITVPHDRIQGVEILENPLRQLKLCHFDNY